MPHQYFELNIDDHKLAVACLNRGANGEPVILLHGITSSISFWEVNPAKYLLDMGPCYAISLPGHFPAVAPDKFKNTPLSAETLVTLLEKAIRQIAGEKTVTVIGHSTGGFAALALAAYKPEIIHRAVSISGFAHGRWTGALGIYQHAVKLGWLGETYFKLMNRMLMLAPALFRWAFRFYAADSQALYAHPDADEGVERGFPNFCRLALDDIIRYFKDMPQIDITSQLANIRAKTLVITGDSDPIVPPAQSYEIARLVQGTKLITLKGSGHLPFLERSVEYNQSLSDWLANTI
jgi:pimeloyl-ACP methyl ester carboxylesterase